MDIVVIITLKNKIKLLQEITNQYDVVTRKRRNNVQMDSEVQRDGRVLDLTDDAWREDRLPYEDVTIPLSELPEAEQDNGGSTESVKEQEMKWSDLALQSLHENTSNLGS
ncbi:anaphase-promoting complex subunit 13 isoform X1 [Xyrauchen texanus]|uniref:anaphase-promoting complex subunit 13 isoform X1 n=2 Tax=Xyrauchen texanus TaxID=154827 RepID=UPI002242B91F|nr:anaphase-promoting complex subunit 13 isoform X1 [Xyrauchen texanus]